MKTPFLLFFFIIPIYLFAGKPSSKKYKVDSLLKSITNLPEESRLESYLCLSGILKDSLPDKSIEFAGKALSIAEKAKKPDKIGEAYSIMAASYYYLSDISKAQNYFAKAAAKFEETGNKNSGIEAYYNNAIMLIVQDKFKKALESMQKSYEFALQAKKQNLVIRISKELAELYTELGNSANAVIYYKKYLILRDSAEHIGVSKKIQLLEIQIAQEKKDKIKKQIALDIAKEKEVELSNKIEEKNIEVQVQGIELNNKKQEIIKKDISIVEKEKKVEKQKKWIIVFVIGLFILISYLFLLFKMYKDKKKTNKTLSVQNEEIKQQKEEIITQRDEILSQRDEITSQRDEIAANRDLVMEQKKHIEQILHEFNQSIDYAQRIQATVLPESNFLDEHFDSHFILYKPKDKVSGDFYWYAFVEGQIIVAVADCTGHGVPGAFMSMLGTSFLREIVQKEYITNPAVILRKLRKEIIKALKQKGVEGEHKDGMDIALVSINKKTKLLHYAGANNSLLYIRNEVKDEMISVPLCEIKADKMPIAIYDQMVNFTNHEIQLLSGDQIYLYSDGYMDQFGGPNSKKFISRNFRKLISEISTESMESQHKILDNTIETWKNGHDVRCEQTDDITVLGIKI